MPAAETADSTLLQFPPMNETPIWAWSAFAVLLAVLLALDLFVHRGERATSHRAAIAWSVVWVAAGLAFGIFVWAFFGGRAAEEYLAAYLIEKSLSLDNLFVFLVIFASLRIPHAHQRKALTWGIFGALVFRGIFVVVGAAAIRRYEWVELVFAAVLLVAAIRSLRGHAVHEEESRMIRWLARHLPVSRSSESDRFRVKEDGRWKLTPLFVAVLGLEATDILFAVDSVPAALAVTRSEFIVYSSNAFAILGLRSLYIVLARSISQLRYLHYGLAAILAFAALKMAAPEWMHIPPLLSVGIIVVIMTAAVLASLRRRPTSVAAGEQRLGDPQ